MESVSIGQMHHSETNGKIGFAIKDFHHHQRRSCKTTEANSTSTPGELWEAAEYLLELKTALWTHRRSRFGNPTLGEEVRLGSDHG